MLKGTHPRSLPEINGSRLSTLACKEGVAGILYRKLNGEGLPERVMGRLRNQYYRSAAVNAVHLQLLERLEGALQKAKMNVLTLKGASLLNHVYADPGLRPMEDLDLLVRSRDRDRFEGILRKMGYRPTSERSHRFIQGPSLIDIHRDPLNTDRIPSRAGLLPLGLEALWERSVPWNPRHERIRRPDDADNLFLLMHHQLKHSFSRIIWLMDVWFLLRNKEARFLSKLSARAKSLNQHRPLSYVFYLLKGFFDYEIPQGSGADPRGPGLSWFERRLLNVRFMGAPFEHTDFFLSLYCLRGFKKKGRFVWDNVFPPRAVLEEEANIGSGHRAHGLHMDRFFHLARLAAGQFLALVRVLAGKGLG